MELDTIETKSTSLTSRLQRCDPQTAQDTTFPASSVEILVLHKGERQKFHHFQNKASKDRNYKQRVQGRNYKHVTHKSHRRQRRTLPLVNYYCTKNSTRNSLTVSMQLKTIETKTTSLTSRLQRCDPQTAQDITFPASFTETLLLHKGERQKPVQC